MIAILAIGLVYCIGLAHHWGPLSVSGKLQQWLGQPYPEWRWRNLSILTTAKLLCAPFALIVWVLWRIEKHASRTSVALFLGLLVLSNYLFQSLGMLADHRGMDLVREIVLSPGATSYFTDATAIQHPLEWLRHFDTAILSKHSSEHPPGPVLFYYVFVRLLGQVWGAMIGGCAVGLLGSAGVLVIYLFAGLCTSDWRARITASAFYALIPSLTLYFPEFDQTYPILSMLLILCWVTTLRGGGGISRFPFCTGVTLFICTLFAYNLLSVGAFLTYYGIYWLWREKWARTAWSKLALSTGITFAVCAGLYGVLWLISGFNPITSFHHGLLNQDALAARLHRPYGIFIVLDLYGFLLGAGIIALPILLLELQDLWAKSDSRQTELALTLIGLATVLTVDLSGMLRGETSRVWLFLQPLLIVPAALKLSRIPRPWKLSIFTVQWLIVVCLKARMSCLNP